MLTNYIKIAFRNIVRHKLYSLINIFGLAIGMACTIMIMLWVQDELSYDKFHEKSDNLYRVIEFQTYLNQGMPVAVTPHPLAASLKKDYPEIIQSARYNRHKLKNLLYKGKRFEELDGATADPSFFKMFLFPFVEGDSEAALSEPYSIVISQNMADKYFGTEGTLGKIIKVSNKHNLKVTGIFTNIPNNSHIQFEYVISFDTLSGISARSDSYQNWGNNGIFTYILLQENADYRLLEKKIKGYIKTKFAGSATDLYLQPLTDIHLHSGAMAKIEGYGSIFNVYLFFIISIFILLISCINYICLTTARYSIRAKEVGIRKVSGAKRSQLIIQFLCESLLITLIALILSLCLVELFLPLFNTLSGKELNVEYYSNLPFSGIVLIIALITGVFSGFYPAFLLSIFKPCDVLKGASGSTQKDTFFRKSMVYLQWIMSIILIIGTWIVFSQFMYLKDKDLGFDRDQIIYLEMDEDLKQKSEFVKNEFLTDPKVISVTSCMQLPNNLGNSISGVDWEGKENDGTFLFYYNSIDFDFIEVFNLKIIEGRAFSREYISDTSSNSNLNIILNEAAIKKMELTDPIGKWFSAFGIKGTIIGVLKDFHFNRLNYPIRPMMFGIVPEFNSTLVVKISPDNMPETAGNLKKKLNTLIPDNTYEFHYFNEIFISLYKSEKMISGIMRYFAFLGIFVASLGLIALVGFMTEQRIKEIGIRKSLGASAVSIILLMSWSYVKLVIIANIIAWPIAWYFLSNWLENYAYRINIGWMPFIGTGLLVLVISQLIVSYHSIKAAMTDPVKALTYE